MNKETIQSNLERFGYDYIDHGQILAVRLGFSLHVNIDLSDPNKIELIERLKSWNFLTGIIETSIKGAILYNTIGSVVVALIFIFLSGYTDPTILIIVFLALMGNILLWTLFYLTKAESFKQQVITWDKK